MHVLIGMDEAGYGPNLGPLVVTATLWHVADDEVAADLWKPLANLVERVADRGERRGRRGARQIGAPSEAGVGSLPSRVLVDDSKKVYSPGKGLAALERGVLSFLAATDGGKRDGGTPSPQGEPAGAQALPSNLAELTALLGCRGDIDCCSGLQAPERDVALPRCSEPLELARPANALRGEMRRQGVCLLAVRSDAVFPRRFNGLLESHGSKGTVLSRVSVELLRRCCEEFAQRACERGGEAHETGVASAHQHYRGGAEFLAIADKHGGRSRYHVLLQEAFPDQLVLRLDEGRARSRYRVRTPAGLMEVCFECMAEKHLPVALASMVSKYVRELFMERFNAFWTARIDGLRPTAGYPVDARRFWAAIRPVAEQLGIPEAAIWRRR